VKTVEPVDLLLKDSMDSLCINVLKNRLG